MNRGDVTAPNVQAWVNAKLETESFWDDVKGELVKMNVEVSLAILGVGVPVFALFALSASLSTLDLPAIAPAGTAAALAAIAYRDNTNCMLGDGSDAA